MQKEKSIKKRNCNVQKKSIRFAYGKVWDIFYGEKKSIRFACGKIWAICLTKYVCGGLFLVSAAGCPTKSQQQATSL
jgi:hypothetical protein